MVTVPDTLPTSNRDPTAASNRSASCAADGSVSTFRPSADHHFVVVGGGAAGLSAVQTLREHGFEGRVSLISKDAHLPYDRIKLSKAPGIDAAKILLRDEAWFDAAKIDVRQPDIRMPNGCDDAATIPPPDSLLIMHDHHLNPIPAYESEAQSVERLGEGGTAERLAWI